MVEHDLDVSCEAWMAIYMATMDELENFNLTFCKYFYSHAFHILLERIILFGGNDHIDLIFNP